jgi:hypothetical protein
LETRLELSTEDLGHESAWGIFVNDLTDALANL